MHETLCTREEIESLLHVRVRNLQLYQEALLHKSAVKFYGVELSNERLEFIGDSVLNLIIAEWIYTKYPHENEGFMTKLRTRIVSGQGLTSIGSVLKLDEHIRMNEKALKQGWNKNARILEDTMESLIGALYLDQGLEMTTDYVVKELLTHMNLETMLIDTNYKDILMRHTQTQHSTLPEYRVVREEGPNHNKEFYVQVMINQTCVGEGMAKNKKQAEQQAAQHALQCLGMLSSVA